MERLSCFGYLHSTMFSINRFRASGREREVVNLHSTMFSINRARRHRSRGQHRLIYIPLCFLLIKVISSGYWCKLLIYIPLCFLLIDYSTDRLQTDGRNLHSTMFSINPLLHLCNHVLLIIYIPLCFLLIIYVNVQKI